MALQESDISTRILSEIKTRTGAVSSERSFLAASCSDGSLTKTRSCSDSDAEHCWIRSAQSFAFSSLFIVYKIPPDF